MNIYLQKTIVCLSLLCLVLVAPVEAKKVKVKQKDLYMIGVAFSMRDSAVFITDMHLVKGLTVEKKNKFLMDRQLYSLQLRRYLEESNKGSGPYVPAVFFSKSRKKMERKYLSLHKRYSQGKEFRIVLVDQSQFRFHPEEYIEQTLYEGVEPTKKQLKKKK